MAPEAGSSCTRSSQLAAFPCECNKEEIDDDDDDDDGIQGYLAHKKPPPPPSTTIGA